MAHEVKDEVFSAAAQPAQSVSVDDWTALFNALLRFQAQNPAQLPISVRRQENEIIITTNADFKPDSAEAPRISLAEIKAQLTRMMSSQQALARHLPCIPTPVSAEPIAAQAVELAEPPFTPIQIAQQPIEQFFAHFFDENRVTLAEDIQWQKTENGRYTGGVKHARRESNASKTVTALAAQMQEINNRIQIERIEEAQHMLASASFAELRSAFSAQDADHTALSFSADAAAKNSLSQVANKILGYTKDAEGNPIFHFDPILLQESITPPTFVMRHDPDAKEENTSAIQINARHFISYLCAALPGSEGILFAPDGAETVSAFGFNAKRSFRANIAGKLLVDTSGSMKPGIEKTRTNVGDFIAQVIEILEQGDTFQACTFASEMRDWRSFAYAASSAEIAAFSNAIAADGNTFLEGALHSALLGSDAEADTHNQFLFVFTDGNDTWTPTLKKQELEALIKKFQKISNPPKIFIFDIQREDNLKNETLAAKLGAEYIVVERREDFAKSIEYLQASVQPRRVFNIVYSLMQAEVERQVAQEQRLRLEVSEEAGMVRIPGLPADACFSINGDSEYVLVEQDQIPLPPVVENASSASASAEKVSMADALRAHGATSSFGGVTQQDTGNQNVCVLS